MQTQDMIFSKLDRLVPTLPTLTDFIVFFYSNQMSYWLIYVFKIVVKFQFIYFEDDAKTHMVPHLERK